ncbi:MAG: VanZ family protein [Oscillospiraceae bacterium]|nr:VanZ family protein [Oscillospiraceae bacterium]
MDWELSIRHLICGYIPVFFALACYFILTSKRKKLPICHIIVSFIFCFYLVGVLTMTGIWYLGSFAPRIVYIPFVDMIRGPVDTALNILLFFPLGLLLPIMYKRYDSIKKVALAGFLISLSIELVQMFECGATDINDLITNTIGACLGYFISKYLRKIFPKSLIGSLQIDGEQCRYELLLFCALSFVSMITVQPEIYHSWFAANKDSGEISIWQ